MNRHKPLRLMVSLIGAILFSTACGTATPAPPFPISEELSCWTVATVIEQGPPAQLGSTDVEIEFRDYFYNGVVTGGGFLKPTSGSIGEAHIGGRKATLAQADFGDGYIATVEFGKIEVLFTSSISADCAFLVATPEQLIQIADWLR